MNRKQRAAKGILWLLLVVLGIYILGFGMKGQAVKRAAVTTVRILSGVEFTLQRSAVRLVFSGAFVHGQ